MNTTDLRHAQHRLAVAQAHLAGQIAEVEQEKAHLFRQGVNESSSRLQAQLARRIQRLDMQANAFERMLLLVHKQGRIVAYLVYAEENRDQPAGLLAHVDWSGVLAEAGATAAAQEQLNLQLDAILSALGIPVHEPRPPAPVVATAAPETGLVQSVPDGDGLKLADHRRVRYVGIDAPEMTPWNSDQPEPFAEEARELNRKLVAGKQVRLERDESDTDHYGRLLRYVYAGNVMVNAELVRAGLARAMSLWPDNKHAELFLDLEAEAKRKKRGVWSGAR